MGCTWMKQKKIREKIDEAVCTLKAKRTVDPGEACVLVGLPCTDVTDIDESDAILAIDAENSETERLDIRACDTEA